MATNHTILLTTLTLLLISCRPDFKTKKTLINKSEIESIAIVVSGDSIKCSWLQLTSSGIDKFVDNWNSSKEMIRKTDFENYHPTLVLVVFSKDNTSRHFETYGPFIQERDHDFLLDLKDQNFFINLETNGPSKEIY
jgi:hypothetical protein